MSSHKFLYSVETVVDTAMVGTKQEMVPTQGREDTISHVDKRKEWTDRYMNVSYPLRKIEITSDYGNRKDPFTGKKSWHNGLDLRASIGEEAFAMMFGQVVKVGADKRSGKYVTLKHGEFTVCYCHLSEALVKKGQIVAAGEPVGLTGSTGRSTGPHLKRGRNKLHPGIILDYVQKIRMMQSMEYTLFVKRIFLNLSKID